MSADAGPAEPIDRGTVQIRETTKWLIASFGAVVAVVAAGVSLAGFGGIDETGRLVAAVAGLGLVATGIVAALLHATDVLHADPVTLADLASLTDTERHAASDPTVLGPAHDLDELTEHFAVLADEEHAAYERYLAAEPAERASAEVAYRIADERAKVWRSAAVNAVRVVKYQRVQDRFAKLRRHLAWQVPAVLVGLVLAAWGLGDDTTVGGAPLEVVPRTPSEVVVRFDPDGPAARDLRDALGADCFAADTVPAVALAAAGDVVTLVTVPSGACPATVVELRPSDATVRRPSGP